MIEEGSTTEGNPNNQTSIEAPTPKKPRNLIFVFMLIGMCLASAILIPRIPGMFTSWEMLPRAPVKPTELLGTTSFWFGPGYVLVRVQDGETYTFDAGQNQWYAQPLGYDFKSEACNLSSLKFLKIKRPFEQPFQCTQVYGHGDIAPAPLFTYVLDQDGTLWYWPQESSLLFLCMLGLLGAMGLVAGVLLNFIWLAIRRAKLNLSHQEDTQQAKAAGKLEYSTLRWVARIWSLVSILYFIWNDLPDYRGLYFQATAVLAIIGLLIGWIRPLIGGLIVMSSFFIKLVITLITISGLLPVEEFFGLRARLSLWSLTFEAIFFMPGLLFLFTGLMERKQK